MKVRVKVVLKVKLLLQRQSITHGTFLSDALMCYVADSWQQKEYRGLLSVSTVGEPGEDDG